MCLSSLKVDAPALERSWTRLPTWRTCVPQHEYPALRTVILVRLICCPRALQLPPGTAADVPLWMVPDLYQRRLVSPALPRFYNARVRADVLAEAGCARLRQRSPYYYELGLMLAVLVQEPPFAGLARHAARVFERPLNSRHHAAFAACAGHVSGRDLPGTLSGAAVQGPHCRGRGVGTAFVHLTPDSRGKAPCAFDLDLFSVDAVSVIDLTT